MISGPFIVWARALKSDGRYTHWSPEHEFPTLADAEEVLDTIYSESNQTIERVALPANQTPHWASGKRRD